MVDGVRLLRGEVGDQGDRSLDPLEPRLGSFDARMAGSRSTASSRNESGFHRDKEQFVTTLAWAPFDRRYELWWPVAPERAERDAALELPRRGSRTALYEEQAVRVGRTRVLGFGAPRLLSDIDRRLEAVAATMRNHPFRTAMGSSLK